MLAGEPLNPCELDVSSQMSERFDGFFPTRFLASNCELEARTNSQDATGYCYGLQVNAAVHPAFRLKYPPYAHRVDSDTSSWSVLEHDI